MKNHFRKYTKYWFWFVSISCVVLSNLLPPPCPHMWSSSNNMTHFTFHIFYKVFRRKYNEVFKLPPSHYWWCSKFKLHELLQKSRNKLVKHLIGKDVIMSLIQRSVYTSHTDNIPPRKRTKEKQKRNSQRKLRLKKKSVTEEIRHQVLLFPMFRNYTLIGQWQIGFVSE